MVYSLSKKETNFFSRLLITNVIFTTVFFTTDVFLTVIIYDENI